jgi:hypothetical protein
MKSMKLFYSKLAMIGLAYGMLGMGFDLPSKRKTMPAYIEPTHDRVIKELVLKGICLVPERLFMDLRYTLQSKLRGQVLFHSDIETKQIFITYQKYKP